MADHSATNSVDPDVSERVLTVGVTSRDPGVSRRNTNICAIIRLRCDCHLLRWTPRRHDDVSRRTVGGDGLGHAGYVTRIRALVERWTRIRRSKLCFGHDVGAGRHGTNAPHGSRSLRPHSVDVRRRSGETWGGDGITERSLTLGARKYLSGFESDIGSDRGLLPGGPGDRSRFSEKRSGTRDSN